MAMWCQSVLNEDFYKYLYTIGPFNDLNSTLIQELLNISYEKQSLKASYFPLLIHENITKLNLSKCYSLINDQVLKLVTLRCKRLTHLNLNGCSRLSNSCLNETIPTLQLLRSLQLSNCRGCSDHLLYNLSMKCCSLQELVVNLCPKITDRGIKYLLSKDNPDRVGCFHLIYLAVSGTSVTTKSLEIILLRLPKLRRLCFSDISGESHLELSGMSSLNIEYLDLFSTFLVDLDIKQIIKCSPKLAVLRLNVCSNLNKIVSNHLSSLSNLKSLDLGGASNEILFEDVDKFLKKGGAHLESLNLSGMGNICMTALCMYCKSLKELILAHCQNIDPILPFLEQRDNLQHCRRNFSDFCPQITHINLNFTTFCESSQPELHKIWIPAILCDHSNLVKLSLKNVDINDAALQQICESSSNLALRDLDLTNCNAITVESVYTIVGNCRKLRFLDLSHCKQIALASVSKLKQELKEACNPLQIVWI